MVTTIQPNGLTDQFGTDDEIAAIAMLDRRRSNLTDPEPKEVVSIFAGRTETFTKYRVEIAFRNKILGGIPKAPDVIESWLRTKTLVSDAEELGYMARETLRQNGVEPGEANIGDMIQASEQMAATKSTNGFKVDNGGLYIEGRQVKALLKEVTNVAFAGKRWGPTNKGPKNYVAERVFVVEDRIHLGRQKPDGIEQIIGHVSGPQGVRSTLAYHELVFQGSCSFTVMSFEDCITADQWMKLLTLGEEEGIGACRSQGHGRFAVQAFDKLK